MRNCLRKRGSLVYSFLVLMLYYSPIGSFQIELVNLKKLTRRITLNEDEIQTMLQLRQPAIS